MGDGEGKEKSYNSGSEKPAKKHKRSKYKKSTYSTVKVYRTLYGLGIGLVFLAFLMTCMAHSNNIVVCAFGYVDPKGALVASFFKEDLTNYEIKRLEPFVWSYGLWSHCINNRCTAVVDVDDSSEDGGGTDVQGESLEYSKFTIQSKIFWLIVCLSQRSLEPNQRLLSFLNIFNIWTNSHFLNHKKHKDKNISCKCYLEVNAYRQRYYWPFFFICNAKHDNFLTIALNSILGGTNLKNISIKSYFLNQSSKRPA